MKSRFALKKSCLALALVAAASLAHADLLGLVPNEPQIDFGADGIASYDAATGEVTVSGLPATLSQTLLDPFIFGEVMGATGDDEKLVTVKFHVDAAGQFVSGIDGPDVVVKGSIDVDFDGVPDYDGVLVEGEVTHFGFRDGGAGDDAFDLRINITGGLLNQPTLSSTGVQLPALYGDNDLALQVASEVSTEFPTPFGGSFAASFAGPAKGILGSVAALPPVADSCKLDVEAACSVDGGPNKSKCRIKVAKSAKHWEHVWFDYHGRSCRKSKYGMHGQSVPSWANKYPKTDVKFTYVVTNTGTTPITNLLIDDSFDAPVSGLPTTLNPGQSISLVRTEKLNERLENVVAVMGESGTAMCSDRDTVVLRDKLRERREHDDDHFKDKGRRGHD